jgi:hypothetical protein
VKYLHKGHKINISFIKMILQYPHQGSTDPGIPYGMQKCRISPDWRAAPGTGCPDKWARAEGPSSGIRGYCNWMHFPAQSGYPGRFWGTFFAVFGKCTMSSEAPAPTDLTASPVKPPSPSSTNAPIEAVELVEPLEPPTKVARTAWYGMHPDKIWPVSGGPGQKSPKKAHSVRRDSGTLSWQASEIPEPNLRTWRTLTHI